MPKPRETAKKKKKKKKKNFGRQRKWYELWIILNPGLIVIGCHFFVPLEWVKENNKMNAQWYSNEAIIVI